MDKSASYAACTVLILCLFAALGANGQSTLSQNSGINSNDTWVVFDMTISSQATINMQNVYYNPQTKTSSNQFSISRTHAFHVEMGYDPNGGVVANLWPSTSASTTNDSPDVSVIRFANGQITLFDEAGNPIPHQLPNSSVQDTSALSLLGSNPGPSVIQSLVVPTLNTFATSQNATIVKSYQSSGDVAEFQPQAGTAMQDLSVPATSSDAQSSTWTYYYSGGYWIVNRVISYPKYSNGSAVQTLYWSNLTWHDNSSADSTRASQTDTTQAPPAPVNTSPSGVTFPSSTSSSTIVNNLAGSQNVAFVHGLFSNPSTWSRMTGWLNQDFLFGTEVVPSLNSGDYLANQCTAFENDINSAGGSSYLFIGHSNGGLVSRCAAQYYQAHSLIGKVKGVATVDSPNQGALLVLNGYAGIAELMTAVSLDLWDNAGCPYAFAAWGCYMAALTTAGAGYLGDWGLSQAFPATADDIPGESVS